MGSVLDLTVYQLCSFGQVFQTLFLCFMFFFSPQKDFFNYMYKGRGVYAHRAVACEGRKRGSVLVWLQLL